MDTIVKRAKRPGLSEPGELALAQYEQRLRVEEDLSSATIRNYLSDLRHFMAWCESLWQQGREEGQSFTPEAVTSPTLTHYRTYLQTLQLKPNSINRSLMSLKRYFAWLITTGQLAYDPAKVVKLVGEEVTSPRHLDDQEEQALVAAVKLNKPGLVMLAHMTCATVSATAWQELCHYIDSPRSWDTIHWIPRCSTCAGPDRIYNRM